MLIRYFSESYAQARERFLMACAELPGAVAATYRNPVMLGPGKEELCCDVVRLGPADAERAIVCVAGTHGVEGFLGSAVQLRWAESLRSQPIPRDTAVLLVHAINPWGFAYRSRTTENNVDLNRNFIDHAAPHPPNETYARLHAALCPDRIDPESMERAWAVLQAEMRSLGFSTFVDGVTRGQYTHREGLSFGGTAPEWSNITLGRIAAEHLARARRVALVDWHTGLGPYGRPFFLCFNDPAGPLHAKAASWWGQGALANDGAGYEGGERPRYTGLLFDGLAQALPQAEVAGAVVEIGTRSNLDMLKALQFDRWLKHGEGVSPAMRADIADDVFAAFCPPDPAWREQALSAAEPIMAAALQGLSRW